MIYLLKKYFTFFLFVFSVSTYAQESTITALVLEGNVTVQNSSTKEWKVIHAGNKLKATDNIKVDEDSYIGLIYKNGTSFEIKKPGIYLLKNFSPNNASGKNLTEFLPVLDSIVNELGYDNLGLEEQTKHRYINVTGSYSSCYCDIKSQIDNYSSIFNDTIYLAWHSNLAIKKEYLVSLLTLYTEVLKSYTTLDTFYTIPVNDTKEKMLLVELSISDKKNTVLNFTFEKLPKEKSFKIKNELESLKTIMGNNDNALNTLLVAYYFKKRGLNMYFYYYLSVALKQSKGLKIYTKLYELNSVK